MSFSNFDQFKETPRDVLLEMSATLSTGEIEKLNELGLKNISAPFLLAPKKLLAAATAEYQTNPNPIRMIQVLLAAFEIYRSSVNRDTFSAPFVKVGDYFEWPALADFDWDNLGGVVFLGAALGAFNQADNLTVMTQYQIGDVPFVSKLNTGTDEITHEELSQLQANTSQVLKYRFPKLKDVALLNSFAWQNLTLRVYATNLMRCLDDLKSGRANPEHVEKFLHYLMDLPNNIWQLDAVRYQRLGESDDQTTNLMRMSYLD